MIQVDDPTADPDRRSGLTLIELLVVLTLLVALGAAVLPPVLERLDEQAFEASADRTVHQLILARAHARATGKPVELVYLPGLGRVEARWLDQEAEAADEPWLRSPASDDEIAGPAIAEPWARQPLPPSITISLRPPASDDPDDSIEPGDPSRDPSASSALEDDTEASETPDAGRTICIHLPDGSAIQSAPVWLIDQAGRAGALSVNPLTGLPQFQRRVAPAAPGESDPASDPDEGEPPGASSPRSQDPALRRPSSPAAAGRDGGRGET